jgi:2-polyprenyl-6-methoxyphenol hydroxylase-like FAD-dependent oxidoreductase
VETTLDGTDVVVAGGGIGGLATAYALATTGTRVRVLEQAPGFAEVGAGLQLAPNATRLLRGWGLLDEVVAAGVLPRRLVLKDALDGIELTSLDLGAGFERRYGAPYVVIHRSDLLTILQRACEDAGVELVPDSRVDAVVADGDGAAARVGDEHHHARIAVAADGLWSSLRGQVSDDEPICSGYVAYRGARPFAEAAWADDDVATDMVVYFGPGCHLVQYPLRRGEVLNTVAVFASPAYRRGEAEWGGPDELDEAFAPACAAVRHAAGRCSTVNRSNRGYTDGWCSPGTRHIPCCSTWRRAPARRWRTRTAWPPTSPRTRRPVASTGRRRCSATSTSGHRAPGACRLRRGCGETSGTATG